MVRANKTFFLIRHVSGRLLRCSYCNEDENAIYRSAIHILFLVVEHTIKLKTGSKVNYLVYTEPETAT